MRIDNVNIIGAGGHAKVVLDALLCANPDCLVCVWDDNPQRHGQRLLQTDIKGPVQQAVQTGVGAHIAIGDNGIRAELVQQCQQWGMDLVTIIHPTAVIAQSAEIAAGCFIAATAIVSAQANVQSSCIINHAAIVDHDVAIGEYSHIAPNVTLGGAVTIGRGVFIGAGATVLPGLSIADNSIIGAGAVVTTSITSAATVVGIPAKQLKEKQ